MPPDSRISSLQYIFLEWWRNCRLECTLYSVCRNSSDPVQNARNLTKFRENTSKSNSASSKSKRAKKTTKTRRCPWIRENRAGARAGQTWREAVESAAPASLTTRQKRQAQVQKKRRPQLKQSRPHRHLPEFSAVPLPRRLPPRTLPTLAAKRRTVVIHTYLSTPKRVHLPRACF